MTTDRRIWTTDELAALLAVSPSTLRRWAGDTKRPLPFRPIRAGQALLWPADSVAAALDLLRARAERGRNNRRPQRPRGCCCSCG